MSCSDGKPGIIARRGWLGNVTSATLSSQIGGMTQRLGPNSHTQWPALTAGCQWLVIEVHRFLRKPPSPHSTDPLGDPWKPSNGGVRLSVLPFCLPQELWSSWRCNKGPGGFHFHCSACPRFYVQAAVIVCIQKEQGCSGFVQLNLS